MCECGIGKQGVPKNAMAATVYICCDSRKETCEYAKCVELNDELISFKQIFCTQPYRREKPKENK